MVTHDPEAADRAKQVLHLHKGVLVESHEAAEGAGACKS
jgi:ABC-type lipoprotein export system ATPase subunit